MSRFPSPLLINGADNSATAKLCCVAVISLTLALSVLWYIIRQFDSFVCASVPEL